MRRSDSSIRERVYQKPKLVVPASQFTLTWSAYIERQERRRRLSRAAVKACVYGALVLLVVSAMWQAGELIAMGAR